MKKLFSAVRGKDQVDKNAPLLGKSVVVGAFNVRVEALVGEGGFASIYRVKDNSTGQILALKHSRLQADSDMIKEVQHEAKTMARLKGHPNCLRLHSVAFAGPPGAETDGFMLLDFCPVTLLDIMQRTNFNLDDLLVFEVFSEVCQAVAHLHRQNPPLTHRDLKAENVLKNGEGRWVLADFGSATTKAQLYESPADIAVEEEHIRRTTTPAYRAPEMWDLLISRQRIDTKADIWALGVLLFLLCFGKLPFQSDSKLSIIYGKYEMPNGRPQAFRDLIKELLVTDPAERPDMPAVLKRVDEVRHSLPVPGSPGATGTVTTTAFHPTSSFPPSATVAVAAPQQPPPGITQAMQPYSSQQQLGVNPSQPTIQTKLQYGPLPSANIGNSIASSAPTAAAPSVQTQLQSAYPAVPRHVSAPAVGQQYPQQQQQQQHQFPITLRTPSPQHLGAGTGHVPPPPSYQQQQQQLQQRGVGLGTTSAALRGLPIHPPPRTSQQGEGTLIDVSEPHPSQRTLLLDVDVPRGFQPAHSYLGSDGGGLDSMGGVASGSGYATSGGGGGRSSAGGALFGAPAASGGGFAPPGSVQPPQGAVRVPNLAAAVSFGDDAAWGEQAAWGDEPTWDVPAPATDPSPAPEASAAAAAEYVTALPATPGTAPLAKTAIHTPLPPDPAAPATTAATAPVTTPPPPNLPAASSTPSSSPFASPVQVEQSPPAAIVTAAALASVDADPALTVGALVPATVLSSSAGTGSPQTAAPGLSYQDAAVAAVAAELQDSAAAMAHDSSAMTQALEAAVARATAATAAPAAALAVGLAPPAPGGPPTAPAPAAATTAAAASSVSPFGGLAARTRSGTPSAATSQQPSASTSLHPTPGVSRGNSHGNTPSHSRHNSTADRFGEFDFSVAAASYLGSGALSNGGTNGPPMGSNSGGGADGVLDDSHAAAIGTTAAGGSSNGGGGVGATSMVAEVESLKGQVRRVTQQNLFLSSRVAQLEDVVSTLKASLQRLHTEWAAVQQGSALPVMLSPSSQGGYSQGGSTSPYSISGSGIPNQPLGSGGGSIPSGYGGGGNLPQGYGSPTISGNFSAGGGLPPMPNRSNSPMSGGGGNSGSGGGGSAGGFGGSGGGGVGTGGLARNPSGGLVGGLLPQMWLQQQQQSQPLEKRTSLALAGVSQVAADFALVTPTPSSPVARPMVNRGSAGGQPGRPLA